MVLPAASTQGRHTLHMLEIQKPYWPSPAPCHQAEKKGVGFELRVHELVIGITCGYKHHVISECTMAESLRISKCTLGLNHFQYFLNSWLCLQFLKFVYVRKWKAQEITQFHERVLYMMRYVSMNKNLRETSFFKCQGNACDYQVIHAPRYRDFVPLNLLCWKTCTLLSFLLCPPIQHSPPIISSY